MTATIRQHQNRKITFSKNSTRVEYFDGRQWLVAPAVILVEGVLNRLLVPADEIELSTLAWNGRMLPIYHPDEGDGSVGSPSVIEKSVIGYFFNSHFENASLKGEMWLDIQKCQAMGDPATSLLNDIEQGNMVELSTGYYCLVENKSGVFNGTPYDGITHHILPDHIALLPGQIGACSLADGCGVPRLNKRSDLMSDMAPVAIIGNGRDKTRFHFEVNEMSHEDVKRLLKAALKATLPGNYWVYVPDVYDDRVIYEVEVETATGYQNDLLKRPYTITEAGVVTLGDPVVKVIPVSQYQEVPGQPLAINVSAGGDDPGKPGPGFLGMIENVIKESFKKIFNSEVQMNEKDKLIERIKNAGMSCLNDEQLAALPEPALAAMASGLTQAKNDGDPAPAAAPAAAAPAAPAAVPAAVPAAEMPAWAQGLVDGVASLTEKVAALQGNQEAQLEVQRNSLISQLVVNELCPLNEAGDFAGLSLPALEKMVNSYQPVSYTGLPFSQNDTASGGGWQSAGLAINLAGDNK